MDEAALQNDMVGAVELDPSLPNLEAFDRDLPDRLTPALFGLQFDPAAPFAIYDRLFAGRVLERDGTLRLP